MKTMNRANFVTQGREALKPLFAMGSYLGRSSIEKSLQELVKLRVSQINGCAFCLDMHWKDARALGENEQRLYGLNVWRESPYYSDRERAALNWAEAVIACSVPDELYAATSPFFTEEELIDLTMVVSTVNTWNQLNIAFPKDDIGTYQPGQLNGLLKVQTA
jgi:AhpD family alkylhydroperoxidase